MDNQKSLLLIVGVLIVGLLLGSTLTGGAIRRNIGDPGFRGNWEPKTTTTILQCPKQITSSNSAYYSAIDGDNIIYNDNRNWGNHGIVGLYRYKLSTNTEELLLKFNISDGTDPPQWPTINKNKIAWFAQNPKLGYIFELHWYDLITKNKYAASLSDKVKLPITSSINLYDNNIVFDYFNATPPFYVYDYANIQVFDTNSQLFTLEIPSAIDPDIYLTNISYKQSQKEIIIKDIVTGKMWQLYSANIRDIYGNEENILSQIVHKNTVAFKNNTGSKVNLVIKKTNKSPSVVARINRDNGNFFYMDDNWIAWEEYNPLNISSSLSIIYAVNINTKEIKKIIEGDYHLRGLFNGKLIYEGQPTDSNVIGNVYLYDLACF